MEAGLNWNANLIRLKIPLANANALLTEKWKIICLLGETL
jgi:hypothetical protein